MIKSTLEQGSSMLESHEAEGEAQRRTAGQVDVSDACKIDL